MTTAFICAHAGHDLELYSGREPAKHKAGGQLIYFLACNDCEAEQRIGGSAQVTGRLMRHIDAAIHLRKTKGRDASVTI